MSKYQEWQKAKKDVMESISWLSNSSKIDSQCHSKYSLAVRLGKESIQYCGQAYAGADNYHSHNDAFREALQKAIKKNNQLLFECALNILKDKEKISAVAASDEVDEMLAEIKLARGE